MAKSRTKLKAPLSLGQVFSGGVWGKKGATLVQIYRVQKAWPSIVGDELSKRTRPKQIRGETLVVAVENSVWAHHLTMMKPEILHALLERSIYRFKDIRFVTESIFKEVEKTPDVTKNISEPTAKEISFVPEAGVKDPDLANVLGRVRQRLLALRNFKN